MTRPNVLHKQARKLVAGHVLHGISKAEAKELGKISSVGSERNYRYCISRYLSWCDLNLISPDFRANKENLNHFLEERAEWCCQKTINQERRSLEVVFKQKLPMVVSKNESVLSKRSYTFAQVKEIIVHQAKKNQITSWLAFFAGTRAHESATILPRNEREPSQHRYWDSRRFSGIPGHYELYTVMGKGGLIREIAVPNWLVSMLESTRRPPVVITDREVRYVSYYDIGIGHNWSESFSSASQRALGFSTGGHGLRHSYAKWRLAILLDQVESQESSTSCIASEKDALLILSQELGHFRLDIAYAYLR